MCRELELDPLHADVIIRRFEAAAGIPAVLVETGERFFDLAARPRREQPDAQGGVNTADLPHLDAACAVGGLRE
jgi:hypothetical protein